MTTQKLVGALNKQIVEALIEKVYLTPDINGTFASKGDRTRAIRAAQLIDSNHKKINRQQLLNNLFPTVSPSSQSDNLRFFRSRFAREANSRLGIDFELVDDKQTNLPDDQRWLWFEGPDPTEMMVDEAIGNANYRDVKHYSPQHSISLNSSGQPKRIVKYFVSLAHDDDEAVNRFLKLFKLNLKGAKNFEFVVWQDKMIEIGQDWREQIKRAINECEFGLLLLSPGFFASDFIKQSELPNFVSYEGKIDGLKKAISVCLKPVSWGATDTCGVESIQVFGVNPRAFSECSTTSKQEQFCKDLFEKLIPLLPVDPPEPPPLTDPLSGLQQSDHELQTIAALTRLADQPIANFNSNHARLTALKTAIDGRPRTKTSADANSETDSADLHPNPLAINELVDWARNSNRSPYMAVLAELGIGKTINLKEFCNRLMMSRRSNVTSAEALPLPVYLDLRLLVSLAKRSKINHDAQLMLNDSEQIVDWLLKQTFASTGHSVKAEDLRDLLARNLAVVIFDSLDEILVQLGTAEAGTFVNTLYRFLPKDKVTQRPLGKMIIACRTHYFPTVGAQNSTLLQQDRGEVRGEDFEALLLLPFDSSQIRTYLSNSLEIQDPSRLDEIMALFASIHNLMDLGSRPLNLWLLKDQIPALERLKAQGRAIRAVDIYDMLVERWLLRDHEKHVMDEGLKPVLMQHLATALWASKQRTWTAAQLDQWLTEFRQSNRSFNVQVVDQSIGSLKEDLRNSTFVTREGDSDLFRFAHSSMQEFFLAKAMFSALTLNVNDASLVWSGPIVSDETFGFLAELLQAAAAIDNAILLDAMRTLADGGDIPIQSQILRYFAMANENCWPTPLLAGLTFNGLKLQHFQLHTNDQADSNLINLRSTTWNATFANESHFSNVDFSGASFNGLEAVGACFETCVFTDCSYVESNFSGGDFRSCEFGFFDNLNARKKLLRSNSFRGALFYKTAVDASVDGDLEPHKSVPFFHFGHTFQVHSIALSADGRRIVSGGGDKAIKLWDAYTGRCEQTLKGHQGWVTSVAISSDGKRIVSGSDDKTIKVWDAYMGRCEQTLQGHQGWVTSVAISNDGKRIVSGSGDNTIKVWDAHTGRCEQTLEGHLDWVLAVALSSDGKRIVSGSDDKTVKVWDAHTGRREQTLLGHKRSVRSVALSSDGRSIVSSSDDKTVKVWDSYTGRCAQTLQGHQDRVFSVALSSDGKRIASGSDDNMIKMWDANTGRCEQTLQGHQDSVEAVALSSDGRRIVSGSDDRTVKVWNTDTGNCELTLRGHKGAVMSVAISPNGNRIVNGSDDNTIKVWNAYTGRCERTLQDHQGGVVSVAISSDGNWIVSGSNDSTIKVWDAYTGRCEQTLEGHQGWVASVALSHDGKRIVSGSGDNTIKVWGVHTGCCEQTLQGHQNTVTSLAISHDGKRIVSGSHDKMVKVWDAYTGHCEKTLQGHQLGVKSVVLSSDGKSIVSGSEDKTIKIWDAYTGQCKQTLQGHQGCVESVALSQDGKRIVSGSGDDTVKVWDAYSGRCEQTLKNHQSWVTSVALSTDSQRLVIGGITGVSIFQSKVQSEFGIMISIYLSRNSICSVDTVKNTFIELTGDAWRHARWHVPSPITESGSQGRDDLWLPADTLDPVN